MYAAGRRYTGGLGFSIPGLPVGDQFYQSNDPGYQFSVGDIPGYIDQGTQIVQEVGDLWKSWSGGSGSSTPDVKTYYPGVLALTIFWGTPFPPNLVYHALQLSSPTDVARVRSALEQADGKWISDYRPQNLQQLANAAAHEANGGRDHTPNDTPSKLVATAIQQLPAWQTVMNLAAQGTDGASSGGDQFPTNSPTTGGGGGGPGSTTTIPNGLPVPTDIPSATADPQGFIDRIVGFVRGLPPESAAAVAQWAISLLPDSWKAHAVDILGPYLAGRSVGGGLTTTTASVGATMDKALPYVLAGGALLFLLRR